MPRKFKSFEKYLQPDPVYGNLLVSKFINCLMKSGEKTKAQGIFYESLDMVKEKVKETEPLELFKKAIDNLKPMLEVRSRRIGGATYQVPVEVKPKRQQSLAFRWLIQAVRGKKGKPTAEKLANELISAYKLEGDAIKKKADVHKMAESNRAFAHFAW
jgi:small subunit ribosomal protein S7